MDYGTLNCSVAQFELRNARVYEASAPPKQHMLCSDLAEALLHFAKQSTFTLHSCATTQKTAEIYARLSLCNIHCSVKTSARQAAFAMRQVILNTTIPLVSLELCLLLNHPEL